MEGARTPQPARSTETGQPASDLGRMACNRERLLQMPVFLSRGGPRMRASDLHESYCPNSSIFELALNRRALRVLDALGIKTVGELLTTPLERLTYQWGFGASTLKVVHDELKRFLLDTEPNHEEGLIDFSSFKGFVTSLIRITTTKPRDVDILEKRLGVGEKGRWSLGMLGEKYGLTRERIRQIEEAGLSKMAMRIRRRVFREFWETVLQAVGGFAGRCEIAHVGEELARHFSWPAAPPAKGLGKLLKLHNELRVDPKAGTVSRW